MKKDLQGLLTSENLDCLIITGGGEHNPPMAYFARGAFFTNADILATKDRAPILFYRPMERDTAAETGLEGHCYSELSEDSFFQEAGKNATLARALEYRAMLEKVGVTRGTIAFCGRVEFGTFLPIARELEKIMPEIRIAGDNGINALNQARFTKDRSEIEEIRKIGKITVEVVGRVESFIRAQFLKDGKLVDQDGNGISIGKIKSLINLWLGELGAENPKGTIFAMGKDAGVPHNSGCDEDILEAGKSIVYDFFPCGMGGGYFFDFTRTWCIGYAPEEVKKAYAEVKFVHDTIISELKNGECFKRYQVRTCEIFQSMGHATPLESPSATSGYCHSIGHGIGLNIHEQPFSGKNASDEDRIIPGACFTVEPGLYYPDIENGFGVRLEDSLYMDDEGNARFFVEYPYELVLSVREYKE